MRVLPAGVIAADERVAVGQQVRDAVAERGLGTHHLPAMSEQVQIRVEADLAERDDDADVRQRVELGVEVGKAVHDLFGRRLVRGRRATDGRKNERVAQPQAVVWMMRRRQVGEAGAMERRHQEVAGSADAVAGEHAARCGWRRAPPARGRRSGRARSDRRSRGPAAPSTCRRDRRDASHARSVCNTASRSRGQRSQEMIAA